MMGENMNCFVVENTTIWKKYPKMLRKGNRSFAKTRYNGENEICNLQHLWNDHKQLDSQCRNEVILMKDKYLLIILTN